MGKRLFIFSVISTLLLSGCGKKTPLEAARPIPLGGSAVTAVDPTTPALTETESAYGTEPATGETAPIEEDSPFGETTDTEEDAPVADKPASSAAELAAKATADAAAKAAADAAAKKKAEDAAKKKAEDAAKAKAEREEEEAKEKAEREAEEAAERAAKTPKFVKSIGNGSLKSAFGVAAASGFLYVVDNARTGLLGSFAAVRQYDVASGDFTKSFENIGWSGAKNMPTTVTRVKFVDGNIVAADSVNSYFYGTDGALIKTEAATFPLTTSVLDPNTDDTFKLNGGKIDRIHNGKVVLSFGADVIDEGNGIAVDEDGNLFVSEKAKGLVHHFAPAAD